jgi:hypothetical protein
VKVGDLVKFKDKAMPHIIGVLISYGDFSEGWWEILVEDGRLVVWPETQIEIA